jgi:hypothetical protein
MVDAYCGIGCIFVEILTTTQTCLACLAYKTHLYIANAFYSLIATHRTRRRACGRHMIWQGQCRKRESRGVGSAAHVQLRHPSHNGARRPKMHLRCILWPAEIFKEVSPREILGKILWILRRLRRRCTVETLCVSHTLKVRCVSFWMAGSLESP